MTPVPRLPRIFSCACRLGLPFLGAAALLLSACSKDKGTGRQAHTAYLGAEANEVRAPGNDPGLDDTYLNVHQGAFAAAQFTLDWADIEATPGARAWSKVTPHVTHAVQDGLDLSLRLTLIDGGVRGRFPTDLEGENFPGWDDQRTVLRLVQLIRDLAAQCRGHLTYLWIGDEVDTYFIAHRAELAGFVHALALCADSLAAPGEVLRLGTTISYGAAAAPAGLLDSLAARVGCLGLDISGRDAGGAWTASPAAVLSRVKQGVDRFPSVPVVLTAVGFPGPQEGSSQAQQEFANLLLAYLGDSPGHLELAFWYPLHDFDTATAGQMAVRRYPASVEQALLYKQQLLNLGLRYVNGVAKPVWTSVAAWNRGHQPVSAGLTAP